MQVNDIVNHSIDIFIDPFHKYLFNDNIWYVGLVSLENISIAVNP